MDGASTSSETETTTGTARAPATGALALAVGVVVIGRNEGERLVRCLESIPADLPVVYVDSGSTDGSRDMARRLGASTVELDMSQPFTAARARNAGAEELVDRAPDLEAIHFFDGDTELQEGWLAKAAQFMADHPKAAAVAGRRRERYPAASWYNEMCDYEWDTPVGQAAAIGGDALFRLSAFTDQGGFNPTVIAGEEPELCYRLRQAGWTVHRLDGEMTLHDAAIHSFGPWWKRATRSGYAVALGALMHGRGPERYEVRRTVRTLIWGIGLPLLALVGLLAGAWWLPLLVIALYGAKWWRVKRRFAGQISDPGRYAAFLMLSNVAEVQGVAKCAIDSVKGRRDIIEYK